MADAVPLVEAPADEATPVSAPSFAGTKHKIKVNDKELEVDYDELRNGYQTRRASEERFEQAAKIRKQVDDLYKKIENAESYEDIARVVGSDKFHKLAEKYFLDKIAYEELPEHEKKARALERRAKEAEEKLSATEKSKREELLALAKERAAGEIQSDIVQAIKDGNITPDPLLVKSMAELMIAHRDVSGTRMKAADAIKLADEAQWKSLDGMLKRYDLKTVIDRLPQWLKDGIRKQGIEAVKSQDVITRKRRDLPSNEPRTVGRKQKMSTENWFSKMEKKLGG